MSKNLFDNDDDQTDPQQQDDGDFFSSNKQKGGFNINKNFAEKFDQVKRKQELQRLESKLGSKKSNNVNDPFFGAGIPEDNEDNDEEEEDYGPEDEDAELITDEHETEFASLLLKLRENDPELKNPQAKFFTDVEELAQAKQQNN